MSTYKKLSNVTENYNFRHLTMQELKVENLTLIWEADTNSRAFQTGLAEQEVNFFFTKTHNIQ